MDRELSQAMPVVPLGPGCIVRLEAISPTTGAAVTGVTVSGAVLSARALDAAVVTAETLGPFMWLPGPGQ